MLSALKKKMDLMAEKAANLAELAAAEFDKIKLSEEDRNARYDICTSCDKFYSPTTTCLKCGCFMAAKTYIPSAACPLSKWTAIPIKQISDSNGST